MSSTGWMHTLLPPSDQGAIMIHRWLLRRRATSPSELSLTKGHGRRRRPREADSGQAYDLFCLQQSKTPLSISKGPLSSLCNGRTLCPQICRMPDCPLPHARCPRLPCSERESPPTGAGLLHRLRWDALCPQSAPCATPRRGISHPLARHTQIQIRPQELSAVARHLARRSLGVVQQSVSSTRDAAPSPRGCFSIPGAPERALARPWLVSAASATRHMSGVCSQSWPSLVSAQCQRRHGVSEMYSITASS